MFPSNHPLADVCEQLEVPLLPREHRIPPKVRDDFGNDQWKTPNLPFERPVAAIRPEASTTEVLPNQFQHLAAVAVLADRQARPHLSADDERRPWRDRHRETSFSVDVPGDVRQEIDQNLPRARVLLGP